MNIRDCRSDSTKKRDFTSRVTEMVLQIPKKSVKFLRLRLFTSLPYDGILLIRNNIEIQSVVPSDESKPRRRRSSSIIGLYPCSHFPLICDTEIEQDGGTAVR